MAIKLKYAGKDVDNGSMSVEDMIPALQGFSSAYGKIANADELQVRHKIRVVGVQKGSFDILLEIVAELAQQVKDNPTLTVSGALVGSFVIKKIIAVIKLTKHVRKQSFDTKINGDNGTVSIINIDKVSLEVPLEVYELYKNKTLHQDISKIVKPLEESKIDSTEILVEENGEVIQEKITLGEKSYFDTEIISVTKTETTELTGSFLSLYKSTNNGFFILNDGARVSYHLKMENPENSWVQVIHKGPVKIKCIAHMDENLKPTDLDIYEIETLQGSLGFKNEQR